MKKSKFSTCSGCGLPLVTYRFGPPKAAKKGMILDRGPKTHPKIKRWCSGFCAAVMAIVGIAVGDVKDVLKKAKTGGERKIARECLKISRWLRKEVDLDFKILAKRNHEFTGVR